MERSVFGLGLGLGELPGVEGEGEESGAGDVSGVGDEAGVGVVAEAGGRSDGVDAGPKVGVLRGDKVNSNSTCQQLAQRTLPSRRGWRSYPSRYLGHYLEIRNVRFTDYRDRPNERTLAVFALGAVPPPIFTTDIVRPSKNLRDGDESEEQVHGFEHGEGHLVYSLEGKRSLNDGEVERKERAPAKGRLV